MDSQRQKEIARKGGRAAHEKGTAHEFTSEEARAAGKKGGERVSLDRNHMSRIGRIGGKSSAGRRPMISGHGQEVAQMRNDSFGGGSVEHAPSGEEESMATSGNQRDAKALN